MKTSKLSPSETKEEELNTLSSSSPNCRFSFPSSLSVSTVHDESYDGSEEKSMGFPNNENDYNNLTLPTSSSVKIEENHLEWEVEEERDRNKKLMISSSSTTEEMLSQRYHSNKSTSHLQKGYGKSKSSTSPLSLSRDAQPNPSSSSTSERTPIAGEVQSPTSHSRHSVFSGNHLMVRSSSNDSQESEVIKTTRSSSKAVKGGSNYSSSLKLQQLDDSPSPYVNFQHGVTLSNNLSSPSYLSSPESPSLNSPSSLFQNENRRYQMWRGNNTFYFNGRMMTGSHPYQLLLSATLILGTSLLFLLLIIPFVSDYTFLFQFLFFCIFWNFFFLFSTAFTEPGIYPKRKINNYSTDIFQIKYCSLLKEVYCLSCGIIHSSRSRHCKFCNNCIEVFDHHCPVS
jgi:hypothetical protein